MVNDNGAFNSKLVQYIRMAKLVQAEFHDIKKFYSTYLNVMMFGGGFCAAYGFIILPYCSDSFAQFFCFFTAVVFSLAPMVFASIYSVFVDRQVSGSGAKQVASPRSIIF